VAFQAMPGAFQVEKGPQVSDLCASRPGDPRRPLQVEGEKALMVTKYKIPADYRIVFCICTLFVLLAPFFDTPT